MAILQFFIAIIFWAAGFPRCLAIDKFYAQCQSRSSCGLNPQFSNIVYPFWGYGLARSESCGRREFKLYCRDDVLRLKIGNVTLRLISMDQKKHKIRVIDENVIEGRCPEIWNFGGNEPYELDDETSVYKYAYTCSPTHEQPWSSWITCQESDGKDVTYYLLDDPISDSDFAFPNCKLVGGIPVLRSVHNEIHNRNLTEVLKEGFDLSYKFEVPTCKRCTDSGGICGADLDAIYHFRCLCKDKPHEFECIINDQGTRISDKGKLAIGIACGIFGLMVLGGGLIIIYRVLSSRNKETDTFYPPTNLDLEAIIPIKQYNYRELKKMTSSFAHIVGKGGFGNVYQGKLVDGRKVAVKILKNLNNNADDFINEVISISQTSHVNIVSLLGFCYQGSTRALIYDFLENGTLQEFISSNNSLNQDMHTLYRIALGIAQGLKYLHYGCKTRIVHFDIKPQNVLLDNDLCPKIADFGLAKICERRESVMSSINPRGTIGYIAPEICTRAYGEVTHKADVYSYGMLIVDMIGARNKKRQGNAGASSSSTSTFFPDWMYESVVNGEYQKILGNEIREEEEDDVGKKMILVGLWCIQTHPSDRPSMEKVVEMMEGRLESIEIPPKVSFQIPTSSLPESSKEDSDSTFAIKETKSSKFVL